MFDPVKRIKKCYANKVSLSSASKEVLSKEVLSKEVLSKN